MKIKWSHHYGANAGGGGGVFMINLSGEGYGAGHLSCLVLLGWAFGGSIVTLSRGRGIWLPCPLGGAGG